MNRRIVFAAGLVGWLAIQSATAQWPSPRDHIVRSAAEWLSDYLPAETVDSVRETLLEMDWSEALNLLEEASHSLSLDDMAWMRDEMEGALNFLESVPTLRNYAAWFRQRLDYFDMAEKIVRKYPVPSAPPRPTAPRPPPTIRPPPARPAPKPPPLVRPPSPPPPVPPAVERRRTVEMLNTRTWESKIRSRPPPPGAGKLVPQLKPIFAEEGVPSSLVWLAEVESSFDPRARSPAGAAGLFQLMPATAQSLGLRSLPFDERYDPAKSARAAARLLKELHGRFGNWPLALAAYNAGATRVATLLRRHSGRSFEDIAPHLPPETRMYVPKTLAVIRVREGVSLARPVTPQPPATRSLDFRVAGSNEQDAHISGAVQHRDDA